MPEAIAISDQREQYNVRLAAARVRIVSHAVNAIGKSWPQITPQELITLWNRRGPNNGGIARGIKKRLIAVKQLVIDDTQKVQRMKDKIAEWVATNYASGMVQERRGMLYFETLKED